MITLGRNPDNDVVLAAEGVSRRHARLRAGSGGWVVVDLGGINGTFLDGERMRANQTAPFVPGSRLQLGPYSLTLEGPESGCRRRAGRSANRCDGGHRGADTPPSLASRRRSAGAVPLARSCWPVRRASRLNSSSSWSIALRLTIGLACASKAYPGSWVTLPDGFVTLGSAQQQASTHHGQCATAHRHAGRAGSASLYRLSRSSIPRWRRACRPRSSSALLPPLICVLNRNRFPCPGRRQS